MMNVPIIEVGIAKRTFSVALQGQGFLVAGPFQHFAYASAQRQQRLWIQRRDEDRVIPHLHVLEPFLAQQIGLVEDEQPRDP